MGAGYEAPAQFAEETRDAARNVPWAIVTSVVATALCGGLHLAALLFSVQVRSRPFAYSIWGYTFLGHCRMPPAQLTIIGGCRLLSSTIVEVACKLQ